MYGITDLMHVSLRRLQELVMDREEGKYLICIQRCRKKIPITGGGVVGAWELSLGYAF